MSAESKANCIKCESVLSNLKTEMVLADNFWHAGRFDILNHKYRAHVARTERSKFFQNAEESRCDII